MVVRGGAGNLLRKVWAALRGARCEDFVRFWPRFVLRGGWRLPATADKLLAGTVGSRGCTLSSQFTTETQSSRRELVKTGLSQLLCRSLISAATDSSESPQVVPLFSLL